MIIEIGAGKAVRTIREIGESYLRSTAVYKKLFLNLKSIMEVG